MLTKKLTAAIIVAAMLCVSFSIVSTENVEALSFIEGVSNTGLDGTFNPNDVAWNTAGTVALAVGYGDGATTPNVYYYYVPTDTWSPLNVPDLSQIFYGVCYDPVNDYFWFCGDMGGGGAPSSVYYWFPPGGTDADYPLGLGGSLALVAELNDIACDSFGQPLVVGVNLVKYYDSIGDNWFPINGDLIQIVLNAVDFNQNDNRFYFGGQYQPGRGGLNGRFYYTDPSLPLNAASLFYQDTSLVKAGIIRSIAWNQNYDYGLVVGEAVATVQPYMGGNATLIWKTIQEIELVSGSFQTFYNDVSWDTDGYNEAAIVGQRFDNGPDWRNEGNYWRYYHGSSDLLPPYADGSGFTDYNCVAFKPPASPKWVFIPLAGGGGGVKINVFMNDASTTVTVNSAFPHIFDINFWDQSLGIGAPSLLDSEVDVGATYTFFLQGNYTVDNVDRWGVIGYEVFAWYDESQTGDSSLPEPTLTTEVNRTRQFKLSNITNTDIMEYPDAPILEFTFHSMWLDPSTYTDYTADNMERRLYINVTFDKQTWAADGDGIWNPTIPGPSFGIWNKNSALLDTNSWDFNLAIYDKGFPTARNDTYEEFGIKEAVSIAVSGNPAGNAPPGSANVSLSNPSTILYSANTNYWVNVSIPNLLKDGSGPDFIPATDIAIRNDHINASNMYTDINGTWPVGRAFVGPDVEWSVWGNRTTGMFMPPALNGTVSAGVWCTDYSAPVPGVDDVTMISWWATVVVGKPEGVYWATITFSIEDMP